jgi:hypothetical protein
MIDCRTRTSNSNFQDRSIIASIIRRARSRVTPAGVAIDRRVVLPEPRAIAAGEHFGIALCVGFRRGGPPRYVKLMCVLDRGVF